MMKVDTIRHYPSHIAEIEEYQRIAASYDAELKLLWDAISAVEKDQNFDTMDEATAERWAALIGVTLSDTDTLADKRRIIKGRWASGLPFTERKFRELLNSVVGPEYYTLTIDKAAKTVTVNLMLAEIGNVNSVYDLLRSITPASMAVSVQVVYNRWSRFANLTWGDLTSHTWQNIYSGAEWQEE